VVSKPQFWSVPACWAGATVAILASGPSMSEGLAARVHEAGLHTIAINSNWKLAPWADIIYAADVDWWHHADNRAALSLPGLKVSCQPVRGVLQLQNTGRAGFDERPHCIRTGGNSGYQALHIAAQARAARVLLLGFDMHEKAGCHWHGPHPLPLRTTPAPLFARWCARFAELAPVLAARGVDVVNCTPGSALKCFRFSTLDHEVAARPELPAPHAALPA
jgi:hypothetical protein